MLNSGDGVAAEIPAYGFGSKAYLPRSSLAVGQPEAVISVSDWEQQWQWQRQGLSCQMSNCKHPDIGVVTISGF